MKAITSHFEIRKRTRVELIKEVSLARADVLRARAPITAKSGVGSPLATAVLPSQ